jgi:hypothetical protein
VVTAAAEKNARGAWRAGGSVTSRAGCDAACWFDELIMQSALCRLRFGLGGESDGVGGWLKRLGVTGSAAEEVTEFIVLSAEPVGRVMLLEAAHTSDPSLDPAMVLFKSIIQVDIRPVADVAAQR